MGIKKKKKKCRELLYRYLKLKRKIINTELENIGDLVPTKYWNKQF